MTKTDLYDAENVPLPDDDESDEEIILEDGDTCTPFELEQLFAQKYRLQDEMALSLRKEYILNLEKDDSFSRLVVGLSDTTVRLFDISSERGLSQLFQLPSCAENSKRHKDTLCGLRFVDGTPNMLLVGTTSGTVHLFDMRTLKNEAQFKVNEEDSTAGPRHFASFDRNANSRLLCIGTVAHNDMVYLNFYDLRERKHMGAYFDSHHDDVTSLQFHPQNPDILGSGSTDGLINIFDLREANEDDALLTTINTESSVHKINWHKNVYNKDFISCITHTNDFKIYESEEGDVLAEFERDKITEIIKRKNPANCTLINVHNTSDGGVFLLTGSNIHKGEVMRSLSLQNKNLLPLTNFEGNKQIVRESLMDTKSNVLITAGEGSIVTIWSPQTTGDSASATSDSSKLKIKKSKSNKSAPY